VTSTPISAPESQTRNRTTKTDGFREYSHREIMEVLLGLMVAMFIANMAGTIVGTALPVITGQLHSTQQQYTWVVTSTLLVSTASTPIWGKMSDLFDKKKLLLVGLFIFTVGSALAGMSNSMMFLIVVRAIQGLGLGANQSLIQAIIGTIIPPRRRGKYMAYTGAVMAVATVIGPLIGGFIVDTSWLGWRWCFWSAVPFAILAIGLLWWKLELPKISVKDAKIDWWGSLLATIAVCAILIWISFVTKDYDWASWQTFTLLGAGVVASVAFILVENRAHDPIIPMPILKTRVTALAVIASISVGVAMFGASVFLAQYFQLARGLTPTESGLMQIPMMVGVLTSSIVVGRLVTSTGVWKPFVVVGAILSTIGMAGFATLDSDTSFWFIGGIGIIQGLGIGMMMQNLTLAVQNSISVRDVGAATAIVTFFRSLGGVIGIQALGLVFEKRLVSLVTSGIPGVLKGAVESDMAANPTTGQVCGQILQGAGSGSGVIDPTQLAQLGQACPNTAAMLTDASAMTASGSGTVDLDSFQYLPFRDLVAHSLAESMGRLFLIGMFISLVAIVAVFFLRPTKLKTQLDFSASAMDRARAGKSVDTAVTTDTPESPDAEETVSVSEDSEDSQDTNRVLAGAATHS
jgi:EmrB/QacA subfamily drug resistance transporter